MSKLQPCDHVAAAIFAWLIMCVFETTEAETPTEILNFLIASFLSPAVTLEEWDEQSYKRSSYFKKPL